MSQNGSSTNTVASIFSKIKPNYVLSINTAHTHYQVHSLHLYPPVPVPQIFTYGTSDPTSISYYLSAESVTPKVNNSPHKDPPNPVPNVLADPDSDPGLSDSSS